MHEATIGSLAAYIVLRFLFTRSRDKTYSRFIEQEFNERRKPSQSSVSYIGQGRRNSESNAEKVA